MARTSSLTRVNNTTTKVPPTAARIYPWASGFDLLQYWAARGVDGCKECLPAGRASVCERVCRQDMIPPSIQQKRVFSALNICDIRSGTLPHKVETMQVADTGRLYVYLIPSFPAAEQQLTGSSEGEG